MVRVHGGVAVAVALLALFTFPTCARADEKSAQREMVAQGRWQVMGNDASGLTWMVDPYTITKRDQGRYEINVMAMNAQKQYLYAWTGTWDINCNENKIRLSGYRVGAQFTSHKQDVFGIFKNEQWLVYSNDSPFKFVADQVCPRFNNVIAITAAVDGINTIDNSIFISTVNNNLRYINFNPSGTRLYFFCDSMREIKSIPPYHYILAEYIVTQGSLDAFMRDWACSKLHPDTTIVPLAFEPPMQPPAPASVPPQSEVTSSAGPSMDEAKRKCADLGFARGTPKYGECVLRLSE